MPPNSLALRTNHPPSSPARWLIDCDPTPMTAFGTDAAAVIGDLGLEVIAATAYTHRATLGRGMPDDVGHRLGDDPVHRFLDGGRQLGQRIDFDGDVKPCGA